MATFRYSLFVSCVAVALACSSPAGQSAAPRAQEPPGVIDPVAPARDSVGPSPKRFEWTAITAADHYAIELTTDIDIVVFTHESLREPALTMPADFALVAGTYFWRVTAVRDGRLVGDSGRSAFVVRD